MLLDGPRRGQMHTSERCQRRGRRRGGGVRPDAGCGLFGATRTQNHSGSTPHVAPGPPGGGGA
eukprot:1182931-Pyramimonas_sp.AAC.1